MSDPNPGGQRRSVASLRAGGGGLIAGRVLTVSEGRFLLADASGAVELEIAPPVEAPEAGDLVLVTVAAARSAAGLPRAGAVQRAGRHAREVPFPSPGADHYRLHEGTPSRAALLARRARCLAAVRAFFDGRGFLEVQTPHRVRCPGLEPHLRALPCGEGWSLITSPEYQMKRLLAAGLEQIYFLGACWRGDEVGRHHLTEFCMLEWYRAWSSIEELMAETEELVAEVARRVAGGTRLSYAGQPLDLTPPFARLTVAEAFRRHAGVELAGVTAVDELRRRVEAAGLGPFLPEEGFEAIASRVLVERVEPALAREGRPVLLHDFPAPLAALSRLRADDPTVAERFELYAGGLELANAFGELTDAAEQRRRLEEDQRARAASGAPVHALDERFLEALREGMPPAAGIALGVDRLLMLVCDVTDIRRVTAFAPDEI